MKTIVLLDMDNVIFDFDGRMIDIVNRRYEKNFTKKDANEWNIENALGIPGINDIWKEKGFFLGIPLLNDAAEWVPRIAETFNTYICSASPFTAYQEKIISLDNYFGKMFEKKIIFTDNKGLARGHYLLDDKTDNLMDFSDLGREGVCYETNHNCDKNGKCRYPISVPSMEEFYHYLRWRNA